jgi:hypothetical protein
MQTIDCAVPVTLTPNRSSVRTQTQWQGARTREDFSGSGQKYARDYAERHGHAAIIRANGRVIVYQQDEDGDLIRLRFAPPCPVN